MDSARLIINNRDLSTATTAYTTRIAGLTVVKAEKGPVTPIRIPANSRSKIQNIFGKASEKYPDLVEALTFNEEFDTYISAPYSAGTKVPVAYVTSMGIYPGTELVEFSKNMENYSINGIPDEELKSDLLPKNFKMKKNTRYPSLSNLFRGKVTSTKDVGIAEYPEYQNDRVLIDLGITAADAATAVETKDGDQGIVINISKLPVEIAQNQEANIFISLPKQERRFVEKDTSKGTWKYATTAPNTAGWQAIPEHGETLENGLKATAGLVYLYENGKKSKDPIGVLVYKNPAPGESPEAFEDIYLTAAEVIDKIGPDVDKYVSTHSSELVNPTVGDSEADLNLGYILNNVLYNDEYKCYVALKGADTNDIFTPAAIKEHLSKEDSRKVILTSYEENASEEDIYAVIYPKYPSTREIKISFKPFNSLLKYDTKTAHGRNLLFMNVHEKGAARPDTSIEVSLDPNDVKATSASLSLNRSESYLDQEFLSIYILKKFEEGESYPEMPEDIVSYPDIVLKGGIRVTSEDIYEKGWEAAAAAAEEYTDADVLFESRRYNTIKENKNLSVKDTKGASFFKLGQYYPLSGFIFNTTVDPIALKDVNTNSQKGLSISNPSSSLTGDSSDLYGAKYWNICNEAVLRLENGQVIYSPMTGSRARMQARIITYRYGGIAPMYLNAGPGLGGQLPLPADASLIALRFKYNKDEQMKLDALNYNPIIKDSTYGIMSVGQKTCKVGALTDWSYIGHACAFLNFQKEVRESVMIPQLGKANNDYYRELRARQVNQILEKRLNGANRIWAQGIVDTSTNEGVNDAINRRARKFIIDVKVKVDIFSEFVELNFTNVDQAVELS